MVMNNEFNYRWDGAVQIRNCPLLEQRCRPGHRRVKSRVAPMLGFKGFFNARRVVAGVELVQKIVKGQFDVPASFGTDPFCIMVQHASGVIFRLSATDPSFGSGAKFKFRSDS